RSIRAGAQLAIELLEDGMTSAGALVQQRLLKKALEVLDLDPSTSSELHSFVRIPQAQVVLQEAVTSRLTSPTALGVSAAWELLFVLAEARTPWCEELIRLAWPADPNFRLRIIRHAMSCKNPTTMSLCESAILDAGFSVCLE